MEPSVRAIAIGCTVSASPSPRAAQNGEQAVTHSSALPEGGQQGCGSPVPTAVVDMAQLSWAAEEVAGSDMPNEAISNRARIRLKIIGLLLACASQHAHCSRIIMFMRGAYRHVVAAGPRRTMRLLIDATSYSSKPDRRWF
jgi:hypothetical protein